MKMSRDFQKETLTPPYQHGVWSQVCRHQRLELNFRLPFYDFHDFTLWVQPSFLGLWEGEALSPQTEA